MSEGFQQLVREVQITAMDYDVIISALSARMVHCDSEQEQERVRETIRKLERLLRWYRSVRAPTEGGAPSAT